MTLDSHVACFNKVLELVVTVWPAISNNIVVGRMYAEPDARPWLLLHHSYEFSEEHSTIKSAHLVNRFEIVGRLDATAGTTAFDTITDLQSDILSTLSGFDWSSLGGFLPQPFSIDMEPLGVPDSGTSQVLTLSIGWQVNTLEGR